MKYNDRQIAALKAKEKRYMTCVDDDLGLYAETMPTGRKFWRLRWRKGKMEQKLTLGEYPVLSLALARDRALEIRQAAMVNKESPREVVNRPGGSTFGALAEQWYAQHVNTWSSTHAADVRHKLDAYILPELQDKLIQTLSVQDLQSVLRPLILRDILPSMDKARIVIGQIFQYGLSLGEVAHNVASDLKGLLPSSRTKRHFASMTTPADVERLMRAIKAYPGSFVVRCALLFSAYTFQRPGEIRRAEWTEISLDEGIWRLPAEKMKARRQHVVPLARQVVGLLQGLQPHTGRGQYVFPALGKSKAGTVPMSENTVTSALRSMDFGPEEMTAHGFRSMASTNLHEQGWPSDIIERQLAHSEGNAVKAAYNYAEFLPQRREMMQAWADWLDGHAD